MAISVSTGLRTLGLESGYDTFFNNAVVDVYSGARPANADTAPTGTKIASGILPADAMAAAALAIKNKNAAAWTVTGIAAAGAGTAATWFRIRSAGDAGTTNTNDPRIDGSVTVTGGGGDMEVDNTSIANAQAVNITAATLTQP